MKRIKVLYILVLMLVLSFSFLLTGCDELDQLLANITGETEQPEQPKKKDSIVFFGNDQFEVEEGCAVNLGITLYKNDEELNLFDSVNVIIDNEEAAKFENGELIAVKAGTAKITLAYKDDETKTFDIVLRVIESEGEGPNNPVNPPEDPKDESIIITFPNFVEEIEVGKSQELNLSYQCNGSVTITVTSSNEEVLEIKKISDNKYDVCGLIKGTAKVNVKLTSATDTKEKEYTVFVTANHSTINYVLDGGTLAQNSPTKYEEGATTYLVNPSKSGYDFVGWCLNKVSTNYIDSITPEYTGDVTVYAVWKKVEEPAGNGPFTITYVYENGALPKRSATSMTEVANGFWADFYAWTKSTETLDAFKATNTEAWKTGAQSKYNLYKAKGKADEDANYFINSPGCVWKTWFDEFDAVVTDINSSQTAWGDYYVGCIRFQEAINQTGKSYWSTARYQRLINAANFNIELIKSFNKGESKALVELVSTGKGNFLGWYDANGTKITNTNQLSKNTTLTAKWSEYITLSVEGLNSVAVNKTLVVYADVQNASNPKVNWSSSDTTVATVDADGNVKGLKNGSVKITATLASNTSVKAEIEIIVGDAEVAEIFKILDDAANPTVYYVKQLPVKGNTTYYKDVYLSASKLLFNFDYTVNRSYEATQNSNTANHGGTMSSIEFITVHYTANSSASAGAAMHAKYFANQTSTSIHYTTGNDGIYHILDDKLKGYHAGDGSATFSWTNTGITATSNAKPTFGVVKNTASSTGYYYTINGQATTIPVQINGTNSSGTAKTIADPAKAFTLLGPAWKIKDGKYYMGTTWACFTQVSSGVIGSHGGNNNSIGIESACNEGTDLWLTYQYTAQLVARLMDQNNLDIYRVVPHNFFSGKNCPQTLLENKGELWYKFIECVEAEYELYTKVTKGGKYSISAKSSNTSIMANNGRILSLPSTATEVSLTVTVKNNSTGATVSKVYKTTVKA